jgi:hypothetical protein
MVKSESTVKLTLVEWLIDPLVATIVAVYVPPGVVTDDWTVRIALPFEPTVRPTFLVLNELVSPAALGDNVADNETVPLKPKLFSVTALVVEPPAMKLEGEGAPAVILKSALTIRVKVTE